MGKLKNPMAPARVQTVVVGESETQQHFKDETDINHIVSRYKRTGVLGSPQDIARSVIYGDFSAIDYNEMLNQVTQIKSQFMTLPPKIRRRFNHDPHTLIAFIENPRNRVEAIKLGLLDMTEEEAEAAAAQAASEKAEADKLARQKAAQTDLVEEAQKADDEANPRKKR